MANPSLSLARELLSSYPQQESASQFQSQVMGEQGLAQAVGAMRANPKNTSAVQQASAAMRSQLSAAGNVARQKEIEGSEGLLRDSEARLKQLEIQRQKQKEMMAAQRRNGILGGLLGAAGYLLAAPTGGASLAVAGAASSFLKD